jgi:hypothetical protein
LHENSDSGYCPEGGFHWGTGGQECPLHGHYYQRWYAGL